MSHNSGIFEIVGTFCDFASSSQLCVITSPNRCSHFDYTTSCLKTVVLCYFHSYMSKKFILQCCQFPLFLRGPWRNSLDHSWSSYVRLIGWIYKIHLLGNFWAANYFNGITASVSPVSSHCCYYVPIFVMETSVQLLIIFKTILLKTRQSFWASSLILTLWLSFFLTGSWKLSIQHTWIVPQNPDLPSFLTEVCILFALKSIDTWMFFSYLHVYYTSSACLFSGDSNTHVYLYYSRPFSFSIALNDFLVSLYWSPEIRLLHFCSAAWPLPCNVERKWWNSTWKSLLLQAICQSLCLQHVSSLRFEYVLLIQFKFELIEPFFYTNNN